MTSTSETVNCPSCKRRAAHLTKEYADPSKRKPAAEYTSCRACPFDSRGVGK